jgi:hypothetical protein
MEKNSGTISPLSLSKKSKLIEFFINLGGVPVFNLAIGKPKDFKNEPKPTEEFSLMRPAEIFLFPI